MDRNLDRAVSLLAESTARRLSRRKVVSKGLKSGFAVAAGLAAGLGMTVKDAEAACTCNWANGNHLNGCPSGSGCPSGWTVCKQGDPPVDYRGWGCNGWCNYVYGVWTSCSGLGTYGGGYKLCTDCKTSTCAVGTCLSACICCSCPQPAP